jgi:hypothetical protein
VLVPIETRQCRAPPAPRPLAGGGGVQG